MAVTDHSDGMGTINQIRDKNPEFMADPIVKGWVSADGKLPSVGNTVDTKTATYANTIGAPELTGSFTDPEFNAKEKAFYYARVIEIPTPTWMDYDHAQFQADPSAEVPLTQQERAVTSPIWYNPR